MADAAISNAQRDRIFNRLGFINGLDRMLELLSLHLNPVNTTKVLAFVTNGDEDETKLLGLRITRAKLRTDTGARGQCFGRIVDGGGGTGHNVQFFQEIARTTLVAQTGATVNDNATGTITPQAGFFLAGAVDIGPIVANVDFLVDLVPPLYQRIDDELDGSEEEDEQLRQSYKQGLATTRSSINTARSAARSAAAALMRGTISRVLVGASNATALAQGNLAQSSVGAITESPIGLLEDLRRAMADNTGGAGAIKVLQQSEAGVVSFPSAFTGDPSAVGLTDRARAGVIQLTCTKGLDSTAPTFAAVFTPSDQRRKGGQNFDQLPTAEDVAVLTVGQTWKTLVLGVSSFQMDYLASLTNTTGASFTTTPADWSVQGLTANNSTDGSVFGRIGTDSVISYYSSSAGAAVEDADDVVASVASPGVGSSFVAQGDSGITITGFTGGAISAGDRNTVNFNPPTAFSDPSLCRITVSVTQEPGLFQALVRIGSIGGVRWRLNSAAGPANVTDDQLTAGQLPGGRLLGEAI